MDWILADNEEGHACVYGIKRNEEGIRRCIEQASIDADRIHRKGFDPTTRAVCVIGALRVAQRCLSQPEEVLSESREVYESRIASVLKSALESACDRHMMEKSVSIANKAEEAISRLADYAAQTGLKADHYLTR